ncbi:TPA: RstC protein, partial [Vibrio vulnificus]|nr:RstC protein [Vibrio vulnificus]
SSGSCPGEMTQNLNNHMLDEIETLQGILSFMRVYPELKAAELAEAS